MEMLVHGPNRSLGRDPSSQQLARLAGEDASQATTTTAGSLHIHKQDCPPAAELLDGIDEVGALERGPAWAGRPADFDLIAEGLILHGEIVGEQCQSRSG
jgi:hypothetical protein